MAQVSIRVNNRSYVVACEDGQEERLQNLAREIDGVVAGLASEVGQVGDTRLMLMASLVVADEIAELRGKVTRLQGDLAEAQRAGQSLDAERHTIETRAAEALARAAGGLEAAALRLERTGGEA